jgi:hypothetical protein
MKFYPLRRKSEMFAGTSRKTLMRVGRTGERLNHSIHRVNAAHHHHVVAPEHYRRDDATRPLFASRDKSRLTFMQALLMRGVVVFIALALIFVLSTRAQEPQKHERQDSPQPIWTGPQLQQLFREAESIRQQHTQAIRENEVRLLRLLTGANALTDKRDQEAIRKYDLAPVIPRIYFDGIQWEQRRTPLRFPEATQ